MPKKTVETTKETPTGRNTNFRDRKTGKDMTRPGFVREIERGNYPDYHVRTIRRVKTPASNPDKSTDNNLG